MMPDGDHVLTSTTRWHHNPAAPPEHFCDDCDQAQQRVAALEAALRNAHDPHDERCASWPSYDRPCDCGVDAILARHAAAEGGGET